MNALMVVSSCRSDFYILLPLAMRLSKIIPSVSLVCEEHCAKDSAIVESESLNVVTFEPALSFTSLSEAGASISTLMSAAEKVFSKIRVDAVFVLGDRFEVSCFVSFMHMMSVPIYHVGGGHVTPNSADEFYRRQISAVASACFVSTEENLNNVRSIRSPVGREYCVGALGLDGLMSQVELSRNELLPSLGLHSDIGDFCIFSYHSVFPSAIDDEFVLVKRFFDCILECSDLSVLVTNSNGDFLSDKASQYINSFVDGKRVIGVGQLGTLFKSAVKNARFVAGNSSAWVIEAPFLRIPSILIGERQTGRSLAKSTFVLGKNSSKSLIYGTIRRCLSYDEGFNSPYGDGRAVERIIKVLEKDFCWGRVRDDRPL